MRILLIGNFAPPYEEESLHNLTLLAKFKQEGNSCRVINISGNPSVEEDFIDVKNYLDFVIKLIRYSFRSNVIHFSTKGYTRPGLMKLMTTVVFCKMMFKKTVITMHSELFSIFGQLRSKMGGQQLLNLSFSKADKVLCGDKHTYGVAALHYKVKDKFEIIPSFIHVPEDLKENELLILKKLQNMKKVVFFNNVRYPSLLFDVLNVLLSGYFSQDVGIIISFSEKFSTKLQHAIAEAEKRLSGNLIFIDPTNIRLLSTAYAKADLILRNLSCDGKPLFDDIALCVRRPARAGNYAYFPLSLTLVKEGDVLDLCAHIFNNVLMERTEALPPSGEDFYARIKEIYSK